MGDLFLVGCDGGGGGIGGAGTTMGVMVCSATNQLQMKQPQMKDTSSRHKFDLLAEPLGECH